MGVPPAKAGAATADQLRDTIWPEIAKWHRQLPEDLKAMIDVQAERVVVVHDPEGAFAVRRTASKDNPEALQGFHAEHLLFLIGEASGIDDIVFEVGMGALSTPGAKVVMAGNPTRASGFFYDTHHSLRHRWHTMRRSPALQTQPSTTSSSAAARRLPGIDTVRAFLCLSF